MMTTGTDQQTDGQTAKIMKMVYLLSGRWAPQPLYLEVELRVKICMHWLDLKVGYTAVQLCGETYWATLSDGQRRMAGQCLSDLVERGVLPLVPYLHSHEYPKKYQLK